MKLTAGMVKDRNIAGFTLVELLIVVALFALLLILVFGSLRFGARAWEGVAHTQSNLLEVWDARTWLTHALERAVPRIDVDAKIGAGELAFDGGPASLSFLGPAPRALSPGGLAAFDLRLAGANSDKRLEVVVRPETGGAAEREPHAAVLLDGVSDLSLSYFGPPKDGGEPMWQDEWAGRNVLPRLIRVRIAFADEARGWPDLVIHPLLDADATCRFDALTRGCAGRSAR